MSSGVGLGEVETVSRPTLCEVRRGRDLAI
jgi:hypothetical protein